MCTKVLDNDVNDGTLRIQMSSTKYRIRRKRGKLLCVNNRVSHTKKWMTFRDLEQSSYYGRESITRYQKVLVKNGVKVPNNFCMRTRNGGLQDQVL